MARGSSKIHKEVNQVCKVFITLCSHVGIELLDGVRRCGW